MRGIEQALYDAAVPQSTKHALINGDARVSYRELAERTNALAAVMPSYMVPRSVTIHEPFPRTASGKIDRTTFL